MVLKQENQEQITLEQFIAKHKLTLSTDTIDERPDKLMAGMDHWKCRIQRPREQGGKRTVPHSMTLYFSMGIGHNGKEPTLTEVLESLASDIAGYANAGKRFEEWAKEYDYDTDSRKAERIFRIIKQSAAKLRKVLGSDAYEELLWQVGRE